MEALKVRGPDNGLLYTIFQNLEFRKLAEELTTGEEKKAVDIRAVKDVKDIEALILRIQTVGYCALTIDGAKGEGLFGGTAVYIALDEGNVYEVSEDALSAFKLVFENKKIIKIVYNLKEALRILSGKNMTVEDGAFDIMLAGYLLGASPTAYELANLAWTYLGSTVSSDQKSADEAKTMIRLYPLLVKELHDKSLVSLLEDIEMPLARVLFTMEANGVALDLPLLKNLSEDCAKKIDELTAALYMMAEEEFNLNSPKQLGYILFDKLKLPGTQKTKTGFSTNESVLTALAEEHIFPSLILEYRQLSKLKSTYIDALPKLVDPETGRLHARFNQTGTETGRLSSSQPNLQNIPARTELGRQIRKSIIASPKGWRLVAADYSQIELRVLAHLSGDANLLKAFNEDEDIHAYTASLIFDKAESDVTPRMRNYAKRVNFGIVYGMSAFGLAKDLKVPQVEAQAFIDKYFLRYPARAAHDRCTLLRGRGATDRGGDRVRKHPQGRRRGARRQTVDPGHARRQRHRALGRAPDYLRSGRGARPRRRPQVAPRALLDREALRVGGGEPDRRSRAPDLRRPRLHARELRGAVLPGAQSRPHLGGVQRDPAPDHRARAPEARPRGHVAREAAARAVRPPGSRRSGGGIRRRGKSPQRLHLAGLHRTGHDQ
jgi:DNA polymerase-1